MSKDGKTKVIRRFCNRVQREVTLKVTIIEYLVGTPKELIKRNVSGIRCDRQKENCPSECDLKSQVNKEFTWTK